MKIAFHFDEYRLKGGDEVVTSVLAAVRASGKPASTKIFIGTLLFNHAASKTSHEGNHAVERVNMEDRARLIEEWAFPLPHRWHTLRPAAADVALQKAVFAVCLETIDATMALIVDSALERKFPDFYLGAIEVDESVPSHLGAYRLCSFGRINGEVGNVFWDGISPDSKVHYWLDWFKNAGFDRVSFESLEGRYTIFDLDHGPEQALRNACSRNWIKELFDTVIDHAMPHLADGAPGIQEKLWCALRAFREMEVSEQASLVAYECRRIFEHIADSLFPPTDSTPDGRKLGTKQYKNRLLKYLEYQRAGHTEQKLIVAAMEAAAAELDNLNEFTNQGVHSDFVRMQARRCLLRTLLLLDDLVSVRQRPLDTKVRHDTELICKIVRLSPEQTNDE